MLKIFDYDNTLAKSNAPLNQAIPDMPRLLGRYLLEGVRVCIASAKSLDERNQLMTTANDQIREALIELDCSGVEKHMERFELYLDKTSTRYVNHGGELAADKKYHVGINPRQAVTLKQVLKQILGIPEQRVIDYPGSIQKQFALTDAWGHAGHAVVYYHPEFGDAVKFLVKPYGWSEDEYRFENDLLLKKKTLRKTRLELAELLARKLKEAGLKGFYVEKGGTVALDITAADKSRVIEEWYARGYRSIQYYGDDRDGSDKTVFDLAEDANTAVRFPGLVLEAILVKGPEDTYCKLLLERFNMLSVNGKVTKEISDEFAKRAAGILMDYYFERGEILRDAVALLTAIATLADVGAGKPGIRELFASVVEKLNDSYTLKNRLAYYKIFAQVIAACRRRPEAKALDEALNRFGLADEAALLARTMKIRKPRAMDVSARIGIKKIFILSRVTIGADIAITSMAFEKMMRVFPDAKIIFLGPSLAQPLFGGNSRIHVSPVHYEIKGGLIGRLNTWLNVLASIEAEAGDEPYIVIDADTRLGQVGLLPFTAGDRGYFFFEPDLGKNKLLAECFKDWLNEIFIEETKPALYPRLYLEDKDVSLAKALFKKCALEDKYVIGVHLGTGGAAAKAVSIPFDAALIQALIREGAALLLYKGVNAQEEERMEQIINELKHVSVFEVRQDEIEKTAALEPSLSAQAIVFSKTGIGVSAAILGRCRQVVCYSSSSKHIAGAQKTPVTVIYIREAGFVDRWVPYTSSAVDVVRISPEEKLDEPRVLSKVMTSVRELNC